MAEKCNENSRQSSRRKKCLLLSAIKNTPMQIKMKTYTYNISDSDFTQWLKIHPDCEKLILEGRIIATEHGRQIQSIEHALITQRLKAIDISGLDAAEFVQCCEMVNYDGDDEYDWDESDGEPYWAHVLAQMLENKDYATSFVWLGDALLTFDLRVLVYHKRTQNTIIIPENVEIIGKNVFQDKEFPKGVILPKTLKVIDDYAFADCYGFSYSKLPDRITHIGKYAFLNCSFNKIIIPKGIEEVSEGCFAGNIGAKISIPPTVKKICSYAFENCYTDVWLPDGVDTIEKGAFGEIKFIHISSTVKDIDKKFYLDEDGLGRIPFIDVSIENPYFYGDRGTLYKTDSHVPYLGKCFVPEQEPSLMQSGSTFVYDCKYSIESLKEIYYSVLPINSEQTLFEVWHGKNRFYNIVDCYGNEYFNRNLVEEIKVSFDHFVIVNDHAVYSIDMKELLLDTSLLEYDITGCDKEGRIYVMKGSSMDEYYNPLLPDHHLPECWCIDVQGNPLLKNRYNGLGQFGDDGWAPACIGKLWGMIDLDENVVIPYAYKEIHPFDSEGMAMVSKGGKKAFINRKGELVIPFRFNYFYKEFDDDGFAYAMIYNGKEAGDYFINRKGEIMGKLQPKDKHEGVWEPGFHLFYNDGKWGYCYQFARKFSKCIYQDICRINDRHINVSMDGINYQQIKC